MQHPNSHAKIGLVQSLFCAKNQMLLWLSATAMRDVCDDIEKQCEDAKANTTIIIGEPQCVKLPFVCEEEMLHWECPLFENEDQDCVDDIGATTHFNVLCVELDGVAKKKKKKKGGTRAIGSPVCSPAPSNRAATKGTCTAKVDDENMEEC